MTKILKSVEAEQFLPENMTPSVFPEAPRSMVILHLTL